MKPVLALFDFDGTITHNWVDRPFMGTAGQSSPRPSPPLACLGRGAGSSLANPRYNLGHSLDYPFPHLRQYAIVVGCITVAPIISKVQMVTATIALTHLLSVVPSYGAFLLLLRFVIADDRFGRAALGLSLPMLGFGYRHGIRTASCNGYSDLLLVVCTACTRSRHKSSSLSRHLFLNPCCWCGICHFFRNGRFHSPTRDGQSFLYVHAWHRTSRPIPFKIVQGIWQSLVGGFLHAMGK